jgi:hypothetical protein
MKGIKSGLSSRPLATFVAVAMVWALCFTGNASAQRIGTIDAGTTITVRTNQSINENDADGQVFTGVVEQDVTNRNGRIAIPRGSDVELVVRRVSGTELALDLDSVMINGQRFSVETESNVVQSSGQKEGIGTNKRTGKYVGGGAVIGGIIGAIAGGGKGAAIGAGAGAAAGAGAQVLTRGRTVRVPAESLLTFRLAEPLRAGVVDNGYMNNGLHYHQTYSDTGRGSVNIGADKRISWRSSARTANLYVQVDNEAQKLFASGPSGTQDAPWMTEGHRYLFVLKDANGNEIARDTEDTRSSQRRQSYRR